MKKIMPCLLLIIFLSACSGSKKIVKSTGNIDSLSVENSASVVRDGSSYEKAIVINEQHETQGIDAEYRWIHQKYPGAKVTKQTLNNYKCKAYDVLYISIDGNGEKQVYFDISNFFGKF